ncbi:hypothetical protein SGO26_30270 (plasmid) [Cupriavidus metallidurans]|uniref:hypothetical protein n=1 Tax=Cupriavidus metallidurans TaxID=119219 RepID=UPI003D70A894
MDRLELLSTAMRAGCFYAVYRLVIAIFYPWLASAVWQESVGPLLVRHWPRLAQADDVARLSYLPSRQGEPAVFRLGTLSVSDVTQGVRDGMLLGVLAALVPEIVRPAFLTFLLAFVLAAQGWRFARAQGAAATDIGFDAVRDVLLFAGAIAAVQWGGVLA